MSTSIVICADSSNAREQIASIFPSDWDVVITNASNGAEGIAAIRAGKADFIFISLGMSGVSGLEVLKVIKDESLPTIAIAIEDEGQSSCRQQAQALGALAFLEKPVNIEVLTNTLNDYGMLDILTNSTSVNTERDENLSDFCQEIANIAMGRAAALLSKVIASKCVLSVPDVTITTSVDLKKALISESNASDVSIVSQGFIGEGIAGEALLTFKNDEVALFAPLLKVDDELTDAVIKGVLLEVTSTLLGSFLTGIADQLDLSFSQNHPRVVTMSRDSELINQLTPEHNQEILAIELNYSFEEGRFICNQRVLFTEHSVARLSQLADVALA